MKLLRTAALCTVLVSMGTDGQVTPERPKT